MGLSEMLQSPAILLAIKKAQSIAEIRTIILTNGTKWFEDHPNETELISNNMRLFGLSTDDAFISDFIRNTILHYFEKLLPLFGNVQTLSSFLTSSVDCSDAVKYLTQIVSEGKGALLAGTHFGAVELIVPALAHEFIPVTPVLKFKTAQFSDAARARAKEMAAGGCFKEINFVEIGAPNTIAAMEMAAVLRRKECLLTMADEKTDYSIPVSLFGKEIYGGAGLDRLVKFARVDLAVVFVAMVRSGECTYRLHFEPIVNPQSDLPQKIACASEKIITQFPSQWYFLHEEIPLVSR